MLKSMLFAFCLMFTAMPAMANEPFDGHVAVFFEIPVADIARAKTFYETVLGVTMSLTSTPGGEMAFFPSADGKVSGALIQSPGMLPSADGTIVYLNGGTDLATILNRVVPAGGTISVPKTHIPGVGHFAHFTDTEGNRIGLFSEN
jgi:predicted enzyme related to lactoylglutathione lyase